MPNYGPMSSQMLHLDTFPSHGPLAHAPNILDWSGRRLRNDQDMRRGLEGPMGHRPIGRGPVALYRIIGFGLYLS